MLVTRSFVPANRYIPNFEEDEVEVDFSVGHVSTGHVSTGHVSRLVNPLPDADRCRTSSFQTCLRQGQLLPLLRSLPLSAPQ